MEVLRWSELLHQRLRQWIRITHFFRPSKMNQILLTVAFSVAIVSTAHAQDPLKLPESEKVVIFKMDFSGGLQMPAAKVAKDPYLQIFADGRVLYSPNSPKHESAEFKLNEQQLNALLVELVDERKFFDIDSKDIAADIKATGQHVMVADAPTVELAMELAERDHEISVYAPSFAATQFPNIESLQHVAKLEKLGRRLVLIAKMGGYERVETALAKVNEELKKKELQLMTVEELQSCKTKDGKTTITFNRKFYKPDGRWRDYIDAKFIVDGDEESVKVKSNIGKETKPLNLKPKTKMTKPAKPA